VKIMPLLEILIKLLVALIVIAILNGIIIVALLMILRYMKRIPHIITINRNVNRHAITRNSAGIHKSLTQYGKISQGEGLEWIKDPYIEKIKKHGVRQ